MANPPIIEEDHDDYDYSQSFSVEEHYDTDTDLERNDVSEKKHMTVKMKQLAKDQREFKIYLKDYKTMCAKYPTRTMFGIHCQPM